MSSPHSLEVLLGFMLDCPDVELPLVEVAVGALASSLAPLERLELAPEPESSSSLLLLLLLQLLPPPLGEWEPAVLRFLLACCRSLPGLSSEAEAEAEAELDGLDDEAVTAFAFALFVLAASASLAEEELPPAAAAEAALSHLCSGMRSIVAGFRYIPPGGPERAWLTLAYPPESRIMTENKKSTHQAIC